MSSAAPQTPPPKCPVCEGGASAPDVEKDGYTFLKCPDCGYTFVHPRPSQEQLAEIYSMGDAGAGITAGHYPKQGSRARRGFLNALRLFRYVWGKRVLDVGCGGGFVAAGMKRLGARQAVGIDINPHAIAYALAHFDNCDFHLGSFERLKDQLHDFDLVYSSEVIEHVEDVEGYAAFLAAITKPGGVVFITTPDIGSPLVPADVTEWNVFTPPVHIQFFTEATLTRLMARTGFTPIKRTPDRGGAGLKMLFRKNA